MANNNFPWPIFIAPIALIGFWTITVVNIVCNNSDQENKEEVTTTNIAESTDVTSQEDIVESNLDATVESDQTNLEQVKLKTVETEKVESLIKKTTTTIQYVQSDSIPYEAKSSKFFGNLADVKTNCQEGNLNVRYIFTNDREEQETFVTTTPGPIKRGVATIEYRTTQDNQIPLNDLIEKYIGSECKSKSDLEMPIKGIVEKIEYNL